ncbi:PREDICTED: uncharacterized protein LOC109132202 [Camelina sativa]|uniref:Uncharacterized protein LOC109132202 n=1 Tax=Camelina sativa TaxID=90675 RepID=A0ABM1RIW5_CAMSA|nr:PREDICTED: uncharacterized protein LOC109132202 [Camelina sativa]
MEATKERMESEDKKRGVSHVTSEAGKAQDNTTVRAIIRESIVEGTGACSDNDNVKDGGNGTGKPDDILVFSRTVRKIDSSLE